MEEAVLPGVYSAPSHDSVSMNACVGTMILATITTTAKTKPDLIIGTLFERGPKVFTGCWNVDQILCLGQPEYIRQGPSKGVAENYLICASKSDNYYKPMIVRQFASPLGLLRYCMYSRNFKVEASHVAPKLSVITGPMFRLVTTMTSHPNCCDSNLTVTLCSGKTARLLETVEVNHTRNSL